MEALVLAGLEIKEGRIAAFGADGTVHIAETDGPEAAVVVCDFLRTSTAPPPRLRVEDAVVYVAHPAGTRGYVIGRVERYRLEEAPAQGLEPVREVVFDAEEKIELRCGKSSLTMRADGKVVVKGSRVVSRASEVNKIKGGSVQIN